YQAVDVHLDIGIAPVQAIMGGIVPLGIQTPWLFPGIRHTVTIGIRRGLPGLELRPPPHLFLGIYDPQALGGRSPAYLLHDPSVHGIAGQAGPCGFKNGGIGLLGRLGPYIAINGNHGRTLGGLGVPPLYPALPIVPRYGRKTLHMVALDEETSVG